MNGEARLYRVILPVADIEQATAFYGAVLGQPGSRVSPGRHYFDCGGTILACFDPVADGDTTEPLPALPDHLYFSVEDLEDAQRRVQAAGGEIVEPVSTWPWGERSFYARDPFENPICFVDAGTVFTG